MRVLCVLVIVVVVVGLTAAAKDWWETALVYHIYPRSFMDSNGDGIGDLNGKCLAFARNCHILPYLQQTGIDAIWLSPIYLSPMFDFGYDITDYRQIAPEYGTMDDFDDLMAEAKRLGVRVILDHVPNHTSNQSEWFIKSERREPGYENFYVWADGIPNPENANETLPPSNWISIFRYSAWEWSNIRKQYYLHQFVVGQPDLNYREPLVQQEMKDVLRFWLDKGVSGFRVDTINNMYEADPANFNGTYPDEPLSGDPNASPDDWEYLDHPYTRDLDETYEVVYDWREILDEYIATTGEYKIMMTEAYTSVKKMMQYYGDGTRNGSIPFNFLYLSELHNTSNAQDMKVNIDTWMTYLPKGRPANWVNGNHDNSRLASRHGTDRVDAMNMLALLLPGVTLTYQGEELGLVDGQISWEDTKDPQACNTGDPINYWKKSRDPARTPYQWDATTSAGFSTNSTTWLPVADNYQTVNLANQMNATKSHYQFYKDVVAIKKSAAVRDGDLDTRALSASVLAVTRMLPGAPAVVGLINLSGDNQSADLSSLRLLPSQLTVLTSGVDSNIAKGTRLQKSSVAVPAHSAIVLQSVASVPHVNV